MEKCICNPYHKVLLSLGKFPNVELLALEEPCSQSFPRQNPALKKVRSVNKSHLDQSLTLFQNVTNG